MTPSYRIVEHAIRIASGSPCQKSKRGEVVFDDFGRVLSAASNRPPIPRICDGTTKRRASCAKRCLHAEDTAIAMVMSLPLEHRRRIEVLHVKVVNGDLVPGDGPSCWQCSRRILDSGVSAIWLFQDGAAGWPNPVRSWPTWVRWPALEFDDQTRLICEVY